MTPYIVNDIGKVELDIDRPFVQEIPLAYSPRHQLHNGRIPCKYFSSISIKKVKSGNRVRQHNPFKGWQKTEQCQLSFLLAHIIKAFLASMSFPPLVLLEYKRSYEAT